MSAKTTPRFLWPVTAARGLKRDSEMNSTISPRRHQAPSDPRYWNKEFCFPHCRLHNVNIVDRFPRDCPLAVPEPDVAIERLAERAEWSPIRGFPPPHVRAIQCVLKACKGCVRENGTHPHIEFLREEHRVNS